MQLRVMRFVGVLRIAHRMMVANVSRGLLSLSARQPSESGHPGWGEWCFGGVRACIGNDGCELSIAGEDDRVLGLDDVRAGVSGPDKSKVKQILLNSNLAQSLNFAFDLGDCCA